MKRETITFVDLPMRSAHDNIIVGQFTIDPDAPGELPRVQL